MKTASAKTSVPDLSWYTIARSSAKRQAKIQSLCEQLARAYQPEKIILFGSQAYGKPTADSDIDLLMVMPFDGHPLEQSARILKQLNLFMPIDLLVKTPKQIQQRLEVGDEFIREILERGKVMYESQHHRMDRKSRR
ncbi:MAG TPA: nucleotidyltransferase domain-containing protein [Blastocatellia bacterium]|nr:nucleotidyltransferase domain-containing protein [Blastocatellia bacterium]